MATLVTPSPNLIPSNILPRAAGPGVFSLGLDGSSRAPRGGSAGGAEAGMSHSNTPSPAPAPGRGQGDVYAPASGSSSPYPFTVARMDGLRLDGGASPHSPLQQQKNGQTSPNGHITLSGQAQGQAVPGGAGMTPQSSTSSAMSSSTYRPGAVPIPPSHGHGLAHSLPMLVNGKSNSGSGHGHGQASGHGYLPTPTSATISPSTHSQSQQSLVHTYSPSPHQGELAYSTQAGQAGPSTYQRASFSERPGSQPQQPIPVHQGSHSHSHSHSHSQSPSHTQSPSRLPAAYANGTQSHSHRASPVSAYPTVPRHSISLPPPSDGRVGPLDPESERSYTEVKLLGDGSFGTVWLCDWHSPVKEDVLLSAMQCGAGARTEWTGKRLVALKRMKRVWQGGWREARNLGELSSLRRIPHHPAIIPLYDAFISPTSRELYFVFECMEGNLYQLTRSRRGRPLAAGLIASCFHQISTGLHHIHQHGYFHRDMKPENLLVTTTGLTDYLTGWALNTINAHRASGGDGDGLPRVPPAGERLYEKDVSVIVKLADFGLARETASKPPYTEYVSTRWYRAPEVLLRSTEYGAPVDMWALGTILAEMLNLKPLFPGVSEIDQVYRICDTLGDPSAEYGFDERGRTIGGGSWNSGIKLAKNVGFSFPRRTPVPFRSLFSGQVPASLVDCIADLLRYNPKYRMTSAQCVDHAYFHETLPHLQRTAPLPRIPFAQGQPPRSRPATQDDVPPHVQAHMASGAQQMDHVAPPQVIGFDAPPRSLPPSHSHVPHDGRPAFALGADGEMRALPPPQASTPGANGIPTHSTSALVNQLRELDLPTDDLASYGIRPVGMGRPGQNVPRQQWQEQDRQASQAASTLYDGSVFEGSGARASETSFNNMNLSVSALQLADRAARAQGQGQAQQPSQRSQQPQISSHVAAYVQQQQQMAQQMAFDGMDESHTPRLGAVGSQGLPVPPPIEPTEGAAPHPHYGYAQPGPASAPMGLAGSLAKVTQGKKKKWGLSSVFGGGGGSGSDKSGMDATHEDYPGTSSLKRTQSGSNPATRLVISQLPPSATPPNHSPQASDSASINTPTVPTAGQGLPAILDPKKAKKEAERQARELEKAKREAAARAQKERARAVLQKREQLVEAKRSQGSKGDIEFGRNFTVAPEAPRAATGPPPSQSAALSSAMLHREQQMLQAQQQALAQQQAILAQQQAALQLQQQETQQRLAQQQQQGRAYASLPQNASHTSLRSHDSRGSIGGGGAGGSRASLGMMGSTAMGSGMLGSFAPQASGGDYRDELLGASRHKIRRRDEDDDVSVSDRGSLMSRSALTIGTIDSDPGPRGHGAGVSQPPYPRQHSVDPLLLRQQQRSAAASSAHSLHGHTGHGHVYKSSRLTSHSNTSVDSQLAKDFMTHANVAGSSQTSLGRHLATGSGSGLLLGTVPEHRSLALPDAGSGAGNAGGMGLASGLHPHDGMQGLMGEIGSAPTSPYGHPKAHAVANGIGMGRTVGLPAHAQGGLGGEGMDWIGPESGMEGINPMFRVPPANGPQTSKNQLDQGSTTLPPFSAIASLAGKKPT